MILELYMKNCALVEESRINLGKNLNILTGETGSGKSIIIDALGLCLGNKYDKSFLRKGTEKGIAEIIVSSPSSNLQSILDEYDIDLEDDELIITRIIYADGKSVARINGRTIKMSILKEIALTFIDLHGQHQNQVLFNKDTHIKFLDLFGGKIIDLPRDEYKDTYTEYNKVKKALNTLNENKDEKEIQREIDLLKFQINEIEAAALSKDEYEGLLRQREIYRNSEKIYNNLNLSYEKLHDGSVNAVDLIGMASKELSEISKYDETISEYSEIIERIMYELQDTCRDLRNYKENIDFEPYELEQIEVRVDEINNLRRKYGDTIDDILKYKDQISSRLEEIVNRDEMSESLKNKLAELEEELSKKAYSLTKVRQEVAINLEEAILSELKSLDMKGVSFKVNFTESNYSQNGNSEVEFMISFNLGEDLKPIYKVASGGEMSRFMLAFKTILADIDEIDTIVFDEIDAGISGIAAQVVGDKLHNIAKKKQILCITHLPQIAANADTHFCISKNSDESRTYTTIKKLKDEESINEIARLIAGSNITDTTIEHAREIVNLTKENH
ncbi:DNA repair protein RecN [Terrisporobacter mayombei]|uniref:DNA repair protein RecN n=1 Tax=Terrisporobacter mayombei TaxID=1541 RepID=A0ABY9Q3A4_9FIRM|nr:DNA repair protein RecN [Terrisporobacter mayombei]MCC3867273.1 DNA repair protein RecN [Terrisporobacter mayombei]WMT81535.1 DNA repair protein RecN [Terrisporobacter mayombei]